ncbi:hypothetical protein K438DRAFT_1764311 [Mycena galopus ATCC 62051]|nr:hypothetical protein K438DRAFT_1764311 [Mycena galopus ATCC 62051]
MILSLVVARAEASLRDPVRAERKGPGHVTPEIFRHHLRPPTNLPRLTHSLSLLTRCRFVARLVDANYAGPSFSFCPTASAKYHENSGLPRSPLRNLCVHRSNSQRIVRALSNRKHDERKRCPFATLSIHFPATEQGRGRVPSALRGCILEHHERRACVITPPSFPPGPHLRMQMLRCAMLERVRVVSPRTSRACLRLQIFNDLLDAESARKMPHCQHVEAALGRANVTYTISVSRVMSSSDSRTNEQMTSPRAEELRSTDDKAACIASANVRTRLSASLTFDAALPLKPEAGRSTPARVPRKDDGCEALLGSPHQETPPQQFYAILS